MREVTFAILFVLSGCGRCEDDADGFDPIACADEQCGDVGVSDATTLPDVPADCAADVCSCAIGPSGGFCQVAFCVVIVEPGAVDRDTTFGLHADTAAQGPLGDRACAVDVDDAPPFSLAVAFEQSQIPEGFLADEVRAVRLDPEPRIVDGVVDVERRRVVVNLSESARIGATVAPARPAFGEALGADRFDVVDGASYIRNLSRFDFGATFHDGQRFYAGNGPRLLIWNDGIPADPRREPDVVLGRPDLATDTVDASASSFVGSVRGIWSDGQRLAVTVANRALIWSDVPQTSFAPADLVLGQDDFVSTKFNRDGPPAADTLGSPDEIWSDGERFLIADQGNHRFLVWNTFPQIIGQPADLVLGQEDFDLNPIGGGALPSYQARSAFWTGAHLVTSSTFGGSGVHVMAGFPTASNPGFDYVIGSATVLAQVSLTSFVRPNSVGAFGDGGFFLQDAWRVAVWRAFPLTPAPADFVFGRPDGALGGSVGRVSAASFADVAPTTHAFSRRDEFVVADGSRLLVWRTLPDYDFAPADLVIGQPAAATALDAVDFRGIDADTLAAPGGISSFGEITVIADRGSSRVLVVRGDLAAPESVFVLGQPDPMAFGPNHNFSEISASTLNDPTNVFTDGKNVLVTDSGNHRVLVWTSLPTAHGEAADLVLGQPDATSGRPNGGAGDADGDGDADADADTFHYPSGVFADTNGIYVADTYNHRVVVYPPVDAGQIGPPVAVVGQPDFTSNEPNAGQGWFSPRPDGLARPTDVIRLRDGSFAVADGENNRVVVYDATWTATAALGQPDLVTNATLGYLQNANTGYPITEASKRVAADTLRTPLGLGATADRLLVADTGNHRVVGYSLPLASGMSADYRFGQPDFDSRVPNFAGVAAESLFAVEGVAVDKNGFVLVSDTGNHRVMRLGQTGGPDRLFGQSVYERNGTHRAAPAFNILKGPRAVAPDGNTLWIADTLHHRVVAVIGGNQLYVIGQPDFGGNEPNAGEARPSATSLSKPTDVWTDGTRMVVADRDNHRVLIWHEQPRALNVPADVVLGQPDATSNAPNRAGPPEANTLLTPEAVWVDGDRLFVADTGNNRVLRWDVFPTVDGAPASAALCQESRSRGLPNRGGATPADDTCATPTDLLVIDGALWVADAQNHRVLRFDASFEDGVSADLVIGQPDFSTRLPLNEAQSIDAATMSSPGGLAFDGVNLFVADSGNHRVLIFDTLPESSGQPASRVVGQPDFGSGVSTLDRESLEAPRGIAVIPAGLNSTTLWIADSGNDRVVSFVRVARLPR